MPVEVAIAYAFLASPYGSYSTDDVIHDTGAIEMQGWVGFVMGSWKHI